MRILFALQMSRQFILYASISQINYLGPPTISPSSPTCGAAGARAFGSVAGAAL